MKKGHSIFTALLAFTVCLQMQAASIVTVDMTELYNGYYKTLEANEKIKGSVKKAEDQTKTLLGEGKALVDEYNEILEMVENQDRRDLLYEDVLAMVPRVKDLEALLPGEGVEAPHEIVQDHPL